MTTKELIELLQEADPDGTSHIRLTGGIPRYVLFKDDDEPYHYIDENGNFITKSSGSKVDIYCDDVFEFVLNKYTTLDSLEEIKNTFIFDVDVDMDYKNLIIREIEDSFRIVDTNIKQLYDESLSQMREKALNGWTWFEKTSENLEGWPKWIVYDENGIKNLPTHTQIIINSGEWIETYNNKINGYKEWVYARD
jgi:hypothetical protein